MISLGAPKFGDMLMEIRLSELEPGEEGVIKRITGSRSSKRRILDMGVIKGEKITVIRRAPLGDPVEFDIKDYKLSLRKKEAETVYVEKLEDEITEE
jgi:Fe2+ transport system protein FeoA